MYYPTSYYILDDSITTTTKCNSPSDYTYNNVTEKYYKVVTNQEFWNDASDACTTEGATLIEHRNVAEHQVLEQMFGKQASKHGYTVMS